MGSPFPSYLPTAIEQMIFPLPKARTTASPSDTLQFISSTNPQNRLSVSMVASPMNPVTGRAVLGLMLGAFISSLSLKGSQKGALVIIIRCYCANNNHKWKSTQYQLNLWKKLILSVPFAMTLLRAVRTLLLLWLICQVNCQKGTSIPMCCCSSKYNHPTLKTTYDFMFHYQLSLMHMNYTAKAFFRQCTKFPQSYTKSLWNHATQYHQLNQDFNTKLKLQPPSEHDIEDLKYCQSPPSRESNRRLLTEASLRQYSTIHFPFPSPYESFPLPHTQQSEEEDLKINKFIDLINKNGEGQSPFVLVRDTNSSSVVVNSYDEILAHLCRRGYSAYFKKEISSTDPTDPVNGDPLYVRLMSTSLEEDEMHQQLFERWLGVFIESKYGQDGIQYFMCPDANAACDISC